MTRAAPSSRSLLSCDSGNGVSAAISVAISMATVSGGSAAPSAVPRGDALPPEPRGSEPLAWPTLVPGAGVGRLWATPVVLNSAKRSESRGFNGHFFAQIKSVFFSVKI